MANMITGVRIVCALSMIFCPTFSTWFYVFYFACGISDVLDGIVARSLGKETKLGARLDTIADIAFFSIALVKVLCSMYVPVWLIIWIACIAVIKVINIFIGFVKYKRFVSEHTVMNRICGVLLFALPLCNRIPQYMFMGLSIFVCCVATFAAFQEGYCVINGKEIG